MEKRFNAMPVITAVMLAVAILALIGWQGLRMSQHGADTPEAVTRQNAPANSGGANEGQPPELRELAFFGKPGEQADEPVERAETLPETNLQLVLRGVMAGDTEKHDSALVEGPDGETKVYRVGDALPGNANLREVRRRRVVIERRGALETLTFPEEDEGSRMALRGKRGAASGNRRTDAADQAATEPASSAGGSSDDMQSRLNELRDRLSN
ncbi:type II secretion system protein N [Halomonadaceae bacterium KBTZ08]